MARNVSGHDFVDYTLEILIGIELYSEPAHTTVIIHNNLGTQPGTEPVFDIVYMRVPGVTACSTWNFPLIRAGKPFDMAYYGIRPSYYRRENQMPLAMPDG